MLEVEPRAWHVTSDPRLRRGGSRRIVSLARRVPPCEAMAPAFDQLARDFSALTVVQVDVERPPARGRSL
jgi:hypothetical protein